MGARHMRIRQLLRRERGAEVIEYIVLFPFVIGAAMIGVQLLLAVSTIVTANSAAREGVRAAVVCDGYWEEAIKNAAPGYVSGSLASSRSVSGKGGPTTVTVRLRIPVVGIPGFGSEANSIGSDITWVTARATMRQEKDCR